MVQRTKGSFTNCPRCAKRMSAKPALSRADAKELVCQRCGREEAMLAYYGATLPEKEEWPIKYF